MTDRKQPSAAFWITVALVAVLVGYPLSFGPWCWLTSRTNTDAEIIPVLYEPVLRLIDIRPNPLANIACWYAELFAAKNWHLNWRQNGTRRSWIWTDRTGFF